VNNATDNACSTSPTADTTPSLTVMVHDFSREIVPGGGVSDIAASMNVDSVKLANIPFFQGSRKQLFKVSCDFSFLLTFYLRLTDFQLGSSVVAPYL
jgi:hypothetical protein